MSAIKLNSSGGGSITISPASTASTLTLTAPATTGTLLANGTALTLMAAQTASGTSVNFTGIPSWVKRVTVMLNGVSTNGTNIFLLQLGAGSYVTSGYTSPIAGISSGSVSAYGTTTNGIYVASVSASTDTISGVLTLVNVTENTWACSGTSVRISGTNVIFYNTVVPIALSAALDRVRIIGSNTGSPVDTFDAGTINVMYEG
jgi:hypothetical protein